MNNHQPEKFPAGARSAQVHPSRAMVERKVYTPPKLTRQGPISMPIPTPAPTPIPQMIEAPRTPIPLIVQVSPVTEKILYQYQYPLAVPKLQSIPRTPPCSIPGYYTSKVDREEPGVGEMLLGCGILLALAVAVITVLFFLAT
jgi:hypothetical protein